MKTPVIVWGASGQAEVVTEILSSSDKYVIAAYIDDVNIDKNIDTFCGKPLLRNQKEIKKKYFEDVHHAIIAIGEIKARVRLVPVLAEIGFTFINAIHESAVIAKKVDLGVNIIIKPGVVIDPLVKIGDHSYLGAGVTVGHHTDIENFVNITGGCTIAGNVHIQDQVYIGTGTSVKDRISIGKNSIIGAGSLVVKDIPNNTVAKGVPAKHYKKI